MKVNDKNEKGEKDNMKWEYDKKVDTLIERIKWADAILVGAAAGMSASCGFNFFYQNDSYFQKYLGEFHKKYRYTGAFNGFYYRYPSSEARWAFLARVCYMEYECETGKSYFDLMELLKGKNYHIMTTNQDFQFTRVVPEEKLSAIQGDSRYYQCSRRCHDEIFYNKDMVYAMNAAIDKNLCIPTDMIPHCPQCGAELEPWVRGYTFLEGEKYRDEYRKINEFLEQNKNSRILFLELGVGRMTPMFIQQPFWNMTYSLPQAYYITINPKDALLPGELEGKGTAIKEDIAVVLKRAVEKRKKSGAGDEE
jgi:NAD-dependent SIR2 family protein deacetylase